MMGPVLAGAGASAGGSGVDQVARDAAAAADIKAQGAVDGLGGMLSGIVVRTVRQDGTGDFATITAALVWFRAQDRRSGARGVIDVDGTFAEDLPQAPDGADESWLRLRGAFEAERVATGATSTALLVDTTDCYLTTVPMAPADAAAFVVGEGVYGHCATPAGGTNDQDRITGAATVYSKAANSVTIVHRGQPPAAVNGFRLVRARGQLVTSQTLSWSGGRTWRPENLLIRANSAPQTRGNHNLLFLDRARMAVVDPAEVVGIRVPSLILVNANAGLVLTTPLASFEGSVALCNMRREGIYTQGQFFPTVVVSTGNGADSVAVAGSGSGFSVRRRPNDMKSIIKRNLGAGVSTLTLAHNWFENDTLLCSGHGFVDFYSANGGYLFTLGLTGSSYSPSGGGSGNAYAVNMVF